MTISLTLASSGNQPFKKNLKLIAIHTQTPLDFWLSVGTIIALFVPIWGVLLAPSRLISVPEYLIIAGGIALLMIIVTLVYAKMNNRILLNRFIIGYIGGLVGTGVIHIFLQIVVITGMGPNLIYVLGNLALGRGLQETPSTSALVMGLIYHYLLNGAAWGAAYGILIGKGRWWLGAFYGMGVWAVLMISPAFYALRFSAPEPIFGLLLIAFLLIGHLCYGGTIGYIVYRYAFPEVGMEGSKAMRPAYR
jgi:hypothetical protein